MGRETAKRLISVIVLAVVGTFLCSLLRAHYERWQAEQLLLVVQKIQVGSADRATVVRVTSGFRKHADVLTDDQIGFVFYNKWLEALRLAPHAEFRVWIILHDGVVVEKKAWEVVSDSGCTAVVSEGIRGYGVPKGEAIPPNHRVFWSDRSAQQFRKIRVEDDDTLPESQRSDDWKLSLKCITRIGSGCRDARTMLPNVVVPSAPSGSA